MSYSRWSGSDWYVFSLARTSGVDTYLEMWFAGAEPLRGATYAQLNGITEDDLAKLVPEAPRDAVPELMEYVREFCADVKETM